MDVRLISLVEKHPFLYNKTHELFKDKFAKENAWKTISETLNIPASECKTRWTSIRNRFTKERSKSERSGSAWRLYKYLSFLQTVIKKRKTFGDFTLENASMKMENVELPITSLHTSSESSRSRSRSDSTSPKRSLQQNNDDDVITNSLDEADDVFRSYVSNVQNVENSEQDFVKQFCLSLVGDLKIMDPRSLRLCKIDLLKTIHEYSPR